METTVMGLLGFRLREIENWGFLGRASGSGAG